MEIKGTKKTLEGIFFRYVAALCMTTIFSCGVVFLLLIGAACAGLTLPANDAEVFLEEHKEEIQKAGRNAGDLLPEGCTYGLYDSRGNWISGNLSKGAREEAWELFEKERIYASDGSYYRFIVTDAQEICVVNYRIRMRYAIEGLNRRLPPPELLGITLMLGLFVLNILILSRSFAGNLRKELQKLHAVTGKISGNDLEFEAVPSDIREVNEVLRSLSHMKDALQCSLKEQWDMEKQKQEQLSALTHDIKTPLTVIRGNAELLAESPLAPEDLESASYILSNVKEIERYLDDMRSLLHGSGPAQEQGHIPGDELEERFREAARQISMAVQIPVSFDSLPVSGEIRCCEERLLRAFRNIVSNAAEHTDPQRGLHISLREREREEQGYLVVSVRDYGPGFTARDLRHAHEEFYSGDASRHDRKHQGLGLSIAARFMEEQGGFLEYGNAPAGDGAEVSLWIKCMD